MRLERLHITVCLGISAIVWFGVLVARGTPVSWDHAAPFSSVVGALVSLGLLLEHYGWRHPLLHGWFVKRPDLRGTWRVELQSSYIDPGTNERAPMIVCYMGVKQTLSTLEMHLMTPESESWFVADRVTTSAGGSYRVVGVYTNEPNVHLRNECTSEIHQGAIIIDTHGPMRRPSTLTAKYWTDRKTTGTMDFTARASTVFTRFSEAHEKFHA
ncbi:MAG: hypothetical protein OXH70_15630 [Acidobacteria bacterium]|nr:hypothetical protein [Acidobacteriota bacterium]